MAVGPYNRDPSQAGVGQISATPNRVLRKIGIRTFKAASPSVRGRGRRR